MIYYVISMDEQYQENQEESAGSIVERSYLHFLYVHAIPPCGDNLDAQSTYISTLEDMVDTARTALQNGTADADYLRTCQSIVNRWPRDRSYIARTRIRFLINQKTYRGAREEIEALMKHLQY